MLDGLVKSPEESFFRVITIWFYLWRIF